MRSHLSALRLVAALALGTGLLGSAHPRPVFAQTITVTTTAQAPGANGDCTLGEAIQAANTNTQVDACPAGTLSDTIVLQPGAIYTLTNGVSGPFGPSAFVITTTIVIQGNGATLAHDPGGGALRFFYVENPGSLTLSNVTLRGGRAKGADGAAGTAADDAGDEGGTGAGGAVLVVDGTLILDGAVFIDNAAEGGRGGDGYTGDGPDDSAGGAGGGAGGGAAYVSGLLVLTSNGAVFSGNAAAGGDGGHAGGAFKTAGAGGVAQGGALFAASTQFLPGARMVAEHNLAQGGQGGGVGFAGDGGVAWGGAVYLYVGTQAALSHSRFYNNRALGGAMEMEEPVTGTPAGGNAMGGAIVSSGQLTLTHTSVVSNTAVGGDGRKSGGAIGGGVVVYFTGSPPSFTLRHSLVMSNTAMGGNGSHSEFTAGDAYGGGLAPVQTPTQIEAVAFVGNAAIQGTNPNTTTVALGAGGGLVALSSPVAVVNATFTNNAARQGGGVFIGIGSSSAVTLTHVTVYSNTAEQGGGLYFDDFGTLNTILLRNSVVAYNTADNCFGDIALAGENLQYPVAGLCGLAQDEDPRLGTLADHGGGTLTVDLLDGSPALDEADPAFCPPTDQRGVFRPLGQACDLGAYERWGQLFLALIKR